MGTRAPLCQVRAARWERCTNVEKLIGLVPTGRSAFTNLARHPEQGAAWAKDEVLGLRGEIRNGTDPLEQRDHRTVEPTICDLDENYLERYARPHKRPEQRARG